MSRQRVTNMQSATKVPLVIATAAVPTQIYRNSDNTVIELTLLVIRNPHGVDSQDLKLLDYDVTDTEGSADITKYLVPMIRVEPHQTIKRTAEELKGWKFKYGVAGYVTTANGLEVYVEAETVGGETR